MEEKGLCEKYVVFKLEDQQMVTDCFVLRPEREFRKGSIAAVEALKAYALATKNRQLAEDLIEWVNKIVNSQ